MGNVHMFIECSKCPYAYRNLKTLETLGDSLSPGTKLLFTFLSLRFFNMRERETQFLTLLTFPSDPTTCGSPKQTTGLASASSGKSTCFVQAQISNNCFFFQIPKSSAHRFRAWYHSHPQFHFLFVFFYCDICDCHILPARAWTPALNVCT